MGVSELRSGSMQGTYVRGFVLFLFAQPIQELTPFIGEVVNMPSPRTSSNHVSFSFEDKTLFFEFAKR